MLNDKIFLIFKLLRDMSENENKMTGKKVLWVEDDLFLSGLLGQKFKSLGVQIFGSSYGEQALMVAKKERPDVILLDLLLPGMSGFEILEKLKAEEKTKDIPVIILSNLSQAEDIEKARNLGAVKFLIKATVSLDDIVVETKKVLGLA